MSVSSNKTAIISASTGTLGPGITEQMKEDGFEVYGGSRSRGDFQYSPHQLNDTAYWYEIIQEYGNTSDTIELVNLIGQSHARGDSTLHDINVKPAQAMVKAAKQYAIDNPEKKIVMVQVSAIAAKYLTDDPYGQSRAEADDAVMSTATEDPVPNFKAVVIQFPFIFTKPDEGGHVKGLHPWSMEQIAGLPVIPVVNDGNQALFPVSQSDAILSVANAYQVEESQIVEAKGKDKVNNKEMIQVFSRVAGRNPTFITLPGGLMARPLDHLHYGLLDGYGPRLMAQLPTLEEGVREEVEPFDRLLGQPAEGIVEQYADIEEGTVTLEKPPVVNHLKEYAGTIGLVALGVGAVGLAAIGGLLWLSTSSPE
jgi:nucleoside-diphosphate-sugar epimerase